jgi:hypothetical protein
MSNKLETEVGKNLTQEQKDYFCRSLKEIFRNTASNDKKARIGSVEYPVVSGYKAIDFDNIKTIYVNNRRMEGVNGTAINYRSNDALILTPAGEWVFVECKDGKISDEVVREITEKLEDSCNIFLDMDFLNKGYLVVDDRSSYLDRGRQPDFEIKTKLEQLGVTFSPHFLWDKMNYCLIYNKKIHDAEAITEADKNGWRDLLKRGEFKELEDFIDNHSYLHGESTAKEFLENCLDNGKYPNFHDVLDVFYSIDDIILENKKLMEFFNDPNERDHFLTGFRRLSQEYNNRRNDINSGEKFIIFLRVYRKWNPGILKALKQKELTLNEANTASETPSMKIFFQLMAKNSSPQKQPRRLFNLHAYEGKRFKKVVTLAEEEFLGYFGIPS